VLDNGEAEALVDCFTGDAILKSPVIAMGGHDEIRAFANHALVVIPLNWSKKRTAPIGAAQELAWTLRS
jgi:hypothetical protein